MLRFINTTLNLVACAARQVVLPLRGNVSDAKKLRALEKENIKLKRMLADAMLDNAALKDLATKNY